MFTSSSDRLLEAWAMPSRWILFGDADELVCAAHAKRRMGRQAIGSGQALEGGSLRVTGRTEAADDYHQPDGRAPSQRGR
jgi:hypothetical protein